MLASIELDNILKDVSTKLKVDINNELKKDIIMGFKEDNSIKISDLNDLGVIKYLKLKKQLLKIVKEITGVNKNSIKR